MELKVGLWFRFKFKSEDGNCCLWTDHAVCVLTSAESNSRVSLYLQSVDTLVSDVQPDGVRHQLRRALSVQDVVDQQSDGRDHGGRHQEAQSLSVVGAGEELSTAKLHHLPFREHLRGVMSSVTMETGQTHRTCIISCVVSPGS